MTFLQLIQPYVQNSTRTTRPRSPPMVSGALLIHGPPVRSGAAAPGRGWPGDGDGAVTASASAAARPRPIQASRSRMPRAFMSSFIMSLFVLLHAVALGQAHLESAAPARGARHSAVKSSA